MPKRIAKEKKPLAEASEKAQSLPSESTFTTIYLLRDGAVIFGDHQKHKRSFVFEGCFCVY